MSGTAVDGSSQERCAARRRKRGGSWWIPVRVWITAVAVILTGLVLPLTAAPLAAAAPGTFTYVVNSGLNSVSVINTATNTVTTTIPVGTGPDSVAITPDSTKAYVTNATSNNVSVINTSTNTVTTTIPVGSSPRGVAVNPAGTFAYVTNSASNSVSVINTSTNAVTTTISLSPNTGASSVAVNQAGTVAYVTNTTSNNVSVINTSTNTVTTTIAVGPSPKGVATSPTPGATFAYVTNSAAGSVSVINTSTNTVATTISLSPNTGANGVAMNPAGTVAYVTNTTSNNVSVINTSTNTVTTTISLSPNTGAKGIAVSPAGTFAYVANTTSNNVSVINVATNSVSTTVSLAAGSAPSGVAGTALPTPWPCTGEILLSAGNGGQTQLSTGVAGAGSITFTTVGGLQQVYNAMSVDPSSAASHITYAVQSSATVAPNLVVVNPDGALTSLGVISGMPTGTLYSVGAYDGSGNFWVTVTNGFPSGTSNPPAMYKVNTATSPATATAKTLTGITSGQLNMGDATFSNGFLWGAQSIGGSPNQFYMVRIDPVSGAVTRFPSTVLPATVGTSTVAFYGGAFTYGNGDLGFKENTTGTFYRVQMTNPSSASPTFTLLSTQSGTAASSNDMTSCFGASSVDLGITKTGPAVVTPGGAITYTLTVKNNGPDNSSGYTVTDTIPTGLNGAATTTPGCAVTSGMLSCTSGPLANGASNTITLTGTAAASGVTSITNTAKVFGNDPDPNPANDTSTTFTAVAQSGTAVATCPAGTVVTGGGFALQGPAPDNFSTKPVGNSWQTSLTNTSVVPISANSNAVCAPSP
ncbi:beta-propeller fold lactonase family protein [Streptomyces sp. NPDC048664]|uniref:DUF6923 family protein n=1 Tax=Streptomyces sp. NPDC048664 TaxID=3154505 RepID=UPI00343A6A38